MAKSKKTKNKSSSGKKQKSQTKKQQESERNIKPSGKKKKKIQEGNKNKVHASGDDDFRKFVEQNNARVINEMAEDGNCLFRSLCDQLHSDFGSKHDVVRSEVCVYLEENEDNFKCFIVVEEDDEMDFDLDDHASSYTEYMDRMKQEGEWGGNAELVAAAQLYRCVLLKYLCSLGFIKYFFFLTNLLRQFNPLAEETLLSFQQVEFSL